MTEERFSLTKSYSVTNLFPNDLALALVSYIAINSSVYNGTSVLPSDKRLELRNMVADSFAQNGSIKNLTDREKQEIYEMLVMISGMTDYFFEDAKKKKMPMT